MRKERHLPLPGGTFSKSWAYWPDNAPLFTATWVPGQANTLGDGKRTWLDWTSGVATNILGTMPAGIYPEPLSPLARPEERWLAEKLCEHIPCADQVRYFKGSSDALQTAVRIARAKTGQKAVAVCGFHGWHDWYAASTARNLGCVLDIEMDFETRTSAPIVKHFPFGKTPDFDGLARLYAAVIVEPIRTQADDDWLAALRQYCNKTGAALVFDETITGLRFHRGGYQAMRHVVPDMAVFGKALANGLPLSVLVGKSEWLSQPVFASPTFATEPQALRMALAVQEMFDERDVAGIIWTKGEKLNEDLDNVLDYWGHLGITRVGLPPWSILKFTDVGIVDADVIRTRLCMHMIDAGHLVNGQHFINLAHTPGNITSLIRAYDGCLAQVSNELEDGKLNESTFRVCQTILPMPGRP